MRGTAAAGRIGPDLTHVAARGEIAAGTLLNSPSTLAQWIADSERLKPGVHMPAFRALTPEDLSALAAYLGGLQ
ncbi:Cytochrome c oxidase subunit 2 precursor [compost metagenome]